MKGFVKTKFNSFIKKNYEGWLFNSLLVTGLLVFTFIPVFSSLNYSFLNYDGLTVKKFIGLQNYAKIFTNDTEIGRIVLNTVIYTFVSIPVTLVFSYLLAWLVSREAKGVGAFRVLYYLPCMIPAVVSGLLWKDIYDPTYGVFNRILNTVGLPSSRFFLSEKTAMLSIFIMNLWGIGGGMILWLAAFQNIPRHLYEAADLDGAGGLHKFFRITIPMSTPMIFFNVITSVIGTLQYTGTLTYAANNGKGVENSIYMYAVKIYNEAFVRGRLGYGSALAWLLLIVIAAITFLLFKTSKWVFYGEEA